MRPLLPLMTLAMPLATVPAPDVEAGRETPSSTFTDCARDCPAMVAIPAGRYTIGSPQTERGRYETEGPQRALDIGAFAMSATEVTRDQYAAFARETRRPTPLDCPGTGDGSTFEEDPAAEMGSWRDSGFSQAGDHPVVCVSWEDAIAYAAWMTGKTRQHYRLPSEAEWEYAARAGTLTPFYWGTAIERACEYANASDPSLVRALPAWIETVRREAQQGDARAAILPCDDGSAFTSAVRRYLPNGFGLYGMSGNVWEHVADCWVAGNYQALAADGSAQTAPGCTRRRLRGGSWNDYPVDIRSARRTSGLPPTQRRNHTGFRVVRVTFA